MPSSPGCSPGSPSSNGDWPSFPPLADPAVIRGIAAYRRHPYQRRLTDPAPVWSEGASRLLDYNPAGAPAVLFVPSLVNRATILDLMPGQSMMRWFAEQGVRPLLLDWGWPGEAERAFTLTDAVGRIGRAIVAIGPAILAGYCMGGTLAVAAAERHRAIVRALVLLAAPWDFHAPDSAAAQRAAATLPLLEPVLHAAGTLPIDALQSLFAAVDPPSIAAKFRTFGTTDQASEAAARFVALEDWLNDGIPLAAPIARETLAGWYGLNTPGRGLWQVGGTPVRPESLRLPSFVAAPGRDRIVPPPSALALAAAIPGAVVHRPASGHIGMAAGPRAEQGLWAPLLNWLRAI